MFFLFLNKQHMLWYSLEAPQEALLMSTHTICFRGEIRKILCGYLLLAGAMIIFFFFFFFCKMQKKSLLCVLLYGFIDIITTVT